MSVQFTSPAATTNDGAGKFPTQLPVARRRITRAAKVEDPEALAKARYIKAMTAAWKLSEEATAVAKAAMDLALLEMVVGRPVPRALAIDVGESAAKMVRAAAAAMAACADD